MTAVRLSGRTIRLFLLITCLILAVPAWHLTFSPLTSSVRSSTVTRGYQTRSNLWNRNITRTTPGANYLRESTQNTANTSRKAIEKHSFAHTTVQGKEHSLTIHSDSSDKNDRHKNASYLDYFPHSARNTFPLTVLPDPYAINNEYVCRSTKHLDLLLLVVSSASNFHARNVVRSTWGNVTFYKTHTVRLVFLLGMSINDSINSRIRAENGAYKDIVQGKFNDSYYNLTHKAVMGMRWASEHCQHARLVAKIDDDMFINMPKLLVESERSYATKSREILCFKRHTGNSIIQRTKGKWQLDKDFFHNMTAFPFPHCNGFLVLFTPDIIKPLYEASKLAPFIWMDDVYLTGLLPEIIGGVRITDLDGVNRTVYYEDRSLHCFQSMKKRCNLLAVITHSPGLTEYLWNIVKS